MLQFGKHSPFVALAPDDAAGGGAGSGQDPTQTGSGDGTAGSTSAAQDAKGAINDLESAKSALAEARKEAAARRKEASDLAARLKAIEDKELSETEKLKRELEALKASNASAGKALQDSKILVAASRMGFANPEDALAFVDRAGLGDGLENLDDALKAVLKSRPYLKAQGAGGSGAGQQQATGNPAGGAAAQLDQQKADRARQLFPFLGMRR